ncbi:hypothetical protein ABEKA_2312 [Acinetobacter lwoffii]|nr:hypothetical protein ABEKA_2312 [Acinetobacter lwoffii]
MHCVGVLRILYSFKTSARAFLKNIQKKPIMRLFFNLKGYF